MARQSASTVRAAALLSSALSLAKACSIGAPLRSSAPTLVVGAGSQARSRTGGREVAELGGRGLDGLAHAPDLVSAEVVHDHAVARAQGWRQRLLDIGQEARAVDRAVEHTGRDEAVDPERGDQGGGLQ
jgi:hypothetical protein